MKNLQTIVQEVIGIIFGIFLLFIWIILITKIAFYFFGESVIVHNTEAVKLTNSGEAFSWLSFGLIPFFIVAGHYLLYSNIIGGIEKAQDIVAMKCFFVGFTIWLILCVITDILKINNPYNIEIWGWGGYLFVFTIYLIFKKRWSAPLIPNR